MPRWMNERFDGEESVEEKRLFEIACGKSLMNFFAGGIASNGCKIANY